MRPSSQRSCSSGSELSEGTLAGAEKWREAGSGLSQCMPAGTRANIPRSARAKQQNSAVRTRLCMLLPTSARFRDRPSRLPPDAYSNQRRTPSTNAHGFSVEKPFCASLGSCAAPQDGHTTVSLCSDISSRKCSKVSPQPSHLMFNSCRSFIPGLDSFSCRRLQPRLLIRLPIWYI